MKNKTEWINRWAGSFSFVSCSHWASQYPKTLKRILGKGFNNVLFVHKKGTVSFYMPKEELDAFGNYLAKIAVNEPERRAELLGLLRSNTDELTEIMDTFTGIITVEQYKTFLIAFEEHLAYHNFMKKSVDYMDQDSLNKLFPLFKAGRLYAEPIYSKTESFFRDLAKAIGEKEQVDPELLTCLTQTELEAYLKVGFLPNIEKLKERFESSVILVENGEIEIFTGEQVDNLEREFFEKNDNVTGRMVYPGKVTGRVRLVRDPFKQHEFNQGDILVTGMTRPEFVPFMEKSAAIVTDAGGMLCHAAITAREMKTPCIIGTENATKVLQDGDIIEVDATKGIVRKIK